MSDGTSEPTDLAAEFASIATVLAETTNAAVLLDSIVQLAVASVDACDYATVMTRVDGKVMVIAVSDPAITPIDQRQIDEGEGPCIDVIDGGHPLSIDDFSTETRWSDFVDDVMGRGVRALFSVHLGKDDPGALNLYSKQANSFTQLSRAQAVIFATHTSLALAAQRQKSQDAQLAEQLRQGLDTRTIIGQAQGILMEREQLTEQQAFDVLRDASQHLNLKLRDVAVRLVETGERPDTGPNHPPPSDH